MALALGYQRAGDLLRAKEYTMQALAADPGNPVALKNLGAILGKEGDSLKALYYRRQSFEIDPFCIFARRSAPPIPARPDLYRAPPALGFHNRMHLPVGCIW